MRLFDEARRRFRISMTRYNLARPGEALTNEDAKSTTRANGKIASANSMPDEYESENDENVSKPDLENEDLLKRALLAPDNIATSCASIYSAPESFPAWHTLIS